MDTFSPQCKLIDSKVKMFLLTAARTLSWLEKSLQVNELEETSQAELSVVLILSGQY